MTGAPPQATDASLLATLCEALHCDSSDSALLRWQFIGSAHGPCRVWDVRGPSTTGAVIVKQFRSDRAFHQERHAYQRWLPHLSQETASLISAHPAPLRALVFTRLAAEPLHHITRDDLPGAATLERAANHRAGAFLRALHSLPEPDPDPLPLADAITQRYAAWLARVLPCVDADTHARLTNLPFACDPELFVGALRVPCHRDFTPSNWLIACTPVGHPPRRLTDFFVVDFEHAHLDCPLFDMVKLWTELWGDRPDLEESFFTGYGRRLTTHEQAQLAMLAALHAMATVAWAAEHADPHYAAAGRHALRRVLG